VPGKGGDPIVKDLGERLVSLLLSLSAPWLA